MLCEKPLVLRSIRADLPFSAQRVCKSTSSRYSYRPLHDAIIQSVGVPIREDQGAVTLAAIGARLSLDKQALVANRKAFFALKALIGHYCGSGYPVTQGKQSSAIPRVACRVRLEAGTIRDASNKKMRSASHHACTSQVPFLFPL